jgi:hypothetical protein
VSRLSRTGRAPAFVKASCLSVHHTGFNGFSPSADCNMAWKMRISSMHDLDFNVIWLRCRRNPINRG